MKLPLLILTFLTSVLTVCAQNYLFQGGKVFKAEDQQRYNTFLELNFFTVNGKITFEEPARIDSIIDISGKFVIPAFADAHTHNLDREWQLGFLPQQYLNEGCYYVLNLTSKKDLVEKIGDKYTTYDTPEVKFSLQGLTSTLGHPFMAYEPFAMGLSDASTWKSKEKEIKSSRLDENNSYIFMDNIKDAEEKLPFFFEGQPYVVKIFLLDAANYEQNASDTIAGNSGLSPEVAAYVVKEAHKKGKRVFAHIENKSDFELAVSIGVDAVAHQPSIGFTGDPGEQQNYYVSDELITKAVAADLAVITTIQWHMDGAAGAEMEARKAMTSDFLRRYYEAGGKVLIGSDRFNKTLAPEIEALRDWTDFRAHEIFRILAIYTPQYIYPERKIGSITESFDADFLVIGTNPYNDRDFDKKIHLKIKGGKILK
ncbi:amidohydrolase family protein [Gilvibacter sediminis]|uniref:amidohydrolase family protein n=1 Tax=Gilvibacter sediminis TaxID=379071 RepID=UPI002350E099|nr:amidohydrolase family protein [Gilvibacter sediminis]MDC7999006.1 amidohydrolase family protein [Gilvibacter sediminis]